nr:hypothetical protein [Paenibacillus xylanexedens]
MVIKNESVTHVNLNQLQIADHFGVNLPKGFDDSSLALLKKVEYVDDAEKYGIIIKDEMINQFFAEFKINLVEKYVNIEKFSDWEFDTILSDFIEKAEYIICGYDYSMLYDGEKSGVGHVSLILQNDTINETTTIYDPGPASSGYKNVNTLDLYKAIKAKKDGLWIISKS